MGISRNVYIYIYINIQREIQRKTERQRQTERQGQRLSETEIGRSAGDIVEPIGVLGSVIEEIRVKMERQWLI